MANIDIDIIDNIKTEFKLLKKMYVCCIKINISKKNLRILWGIRIL